MQPFHPSRIGNEKQPEELHLFNNTSGPHLPPTTGPIWTGSEQFSETPRSVEMD